MAFLDRIINTAFVARLLSYSRSMHAFVRSNFYIFSRRLYVFVGDERRLPLPTTTAVDDCIAHRASGTLPLFRPAGGGRCLANETRMFYARCCTMAMLMGGRLRV
ncbi:uncharacterized protein SPSK_00352 [Sporothrix schenckii 1099-18]|uniref:Uncharacterized protein n=1 Tax=Sporothrix schenckii 1099-18 TaxID=1397361 RepID=A0A0F2M2R5_SPOSC|nr:uncharacterized protein SPSK_00352 [Sporothrix schenckii 1099-18]KJR83982.1 hypothetical protein SPSK_00352 [Sporothrix schenckii 1099-18]